MNELIFLKENFNIIRISFLKKGIVQKKVYSWYLPYFLSERVHLNTVAMIRINNRIKKVFVVALSYDIRAQNLYELFPLVKCKPSWQIQLICQHLTRKNIKYNRERGFSGLTGMHNKPLLVDISFQINGQWYFIEYHGIHHYYKGHITVQRFRNIRKNMEIRRAWCKEHQVPYLEIPFFRQSELFFLVDKFLSEQLS